MKDNQIIVFKPEERLTLNGMTDEVFFERFNGLHYLLVLDLDQSVLAGCRSSKVELMVDAVRDLYPQQSLHSAVYIEGPEAIKSFENAYKNNLLQI